MDKQILLDNYITRRNYFNNVFNKGINKINNYKTININTISNKLVSKNKCNNFEIKLPNLTSQKNLTTDEEEKKSYENYA